MIPTQTAPQIVRMIYYRAATVPQVVPYSIPESNHLIELITAGIVYDDADGVSKSVGCGALFWHIAGEQTIFRTDRSNPYECLSIRIDVPPDAQRPVHRWSQITDHQRVRELSTELLRSYHDDSISRVDLAEYVYHRLIWECRLAKASRSHELPPAVGAALRVVESQYQDPGLDVAAIAAVAGISEAHLYALFRSYLGQTPHQFLSARRIREAKWRLSSTASVIKEVAADSGFLNIETFYRVFKKQVGCTPGEFRDTHSRESL